jgi:DNA-binding transcriptional regulator YdaS (Cro superfamily)
MLRPMKAIHVAVQAAGGQSALAGGIGATQQQVWNWLRRGDAVPPEFCAQIELFLRGAVTRWQLRPDDWHRIWPELVGTEGAPPIPVPAAPAATAEAGHAAA